MTHSLAVLATTLCYREPAVAYLVFEEWIGSVVYLNSCYVEPSVRCLGIATWLMCETLAMVSGHVFGIVNRNSPEMIRIFENLGFTPDREASAPFGGLNYFLKVQEFSLYDFGISKLKIGKPRLTKQYLDSARVLPMRFLIYE